MWDSLSSLPRVCCLLTHPQVLSSSYEKENLQLFLVCCLQEMGPFRDKVRIPIRSITLLLLFTNLQWLPVACMCPILALEALHM